MKKPCPLPFTQMVLHPNGDVTPCCFLGNYVLGNAKRRSLTDIWNGRKARSSAPRVHEGEARTCSDTMKIWGCHLENEQLRDVVEISEVQSGPAKRLDLRLNGQCNLECVMCNVWEMANGTYDRTEFWKEGPKRLFPSIREIAVLGGEPFVQKDTFRLIDAVSAVNPECLWMFTTNGHWRFNPFVREKLDLLRIRSITLSIDSLKPSVFKKIRLGGELGRALETLEDLKRYRAGRGKGRSFELVLNVVVQKRNFSEIPDFLRFSEKHGLRPVFIPMLRSRKAGESILNFGMRKRRELLRQARDLQGKKGAPGLLPVVRILEESLTSCFLLDSAEAVLRETEPI